MENDGIMKIENSINMTFTQENQEQGDIRYFGFTVGIIVFFVGNVGNGLTVWAYLRNKHLQSSFNVLIANLCLIDLFFTVIVVPFLLPGYIGGSSLYSEGFCSMTAYLYYVTLAASLYNLTAIAVNRYIGVVIAKSYQKLFTGQRLTVLMLSIWIIPALLYIPLVTSGGYKWSNDVMRCAVSIELAPGIRAYHLALNILFQAVPLLFLIFAYTAIFTEVKRVKSKLKSHRNPKKSTRSTSSLNSIRRNKSGNTSDETGDELPPSSLVEGIGFKPVKIKKQHRDAASLSHDTSQKGSDETENATPTKKKIIQTNESQHIVSQPNNQRKRNSVWQLLLNNNRNKANIKPKSEHDETDTCFPVHSENFNNSFLEEMNNQEYQKQDETLPDLIPLNNLHRKKSISTPTLPMLDLANFDLSRPESKVNGFPTYIHRNYEDLTEGQDKFHRTTSLKITRTRTQSDTAQSSTSRQSLRNKRRDKPSTTSSLQGEDGHNQKKNPTTNLKKTSSTLSRGKTLRKKKNRERQLAYSSFMICLAFAVCIMPTSTLYIVRSLTKIEVNPAVVLVISCISWFHAVVNPWIYGYLNPQYRKEYRKIIQLIKNKICGNDKRQAKAYEIGQKC